MDRTRLVLSRKDGESLWIGDVRVQVKLPKGSRVSLTCEAPRDVKIMREELRGRGK